MERHLRIGELAAGVGVTAKTIRYYEEIGLLPPPRRSEHGYRLYGADDAGRLRFIAAARRVGFTLGEIKDMLALRDRGRRPCEYVADALDRRLREIDQQQAQLRALKAELTRLRKRA
ncbi:MAG: heavy metal-responsive transcriptional regulator [Thermoleophilaceae bacterium]